MSFFRILRERERERERETEKEREMIIYNYVLLK